MVAVRPYERQAEDDSPTAAAGVRNALSARRRAAVRGMATAGWPTG